MKKAVLLAFATLCLFEAGGLIKVVVSAQAGPPVSYDIVYVRAPRHGDNNNSFWPDAVTPLLPEPGADLMLLHPNGTEEVLFAAGPDGAVVDPNVSYDARSVVFSYFANARNVNVQRGVNSTNALSRDGADIYRIDLSTRAITRLTFQEFTPNTGNNANFDCARSGTNCPNVGVFNTGPAFLADDRIVFTSTRDNFIPNKMTNAGQRTMQLWVMDGDGKNAHPIGFLNVASAMHPFVLRDGRIVFTSWENMGARDDRVFTLWSIYPDGTHFEPFSGFGDGPFAHHFMTQLSDGSIVVCRYYNLNNNGFGELYRFPLGIDPAFQPIPPDNSAGDQIPLQRIGYTRLTPFTSADDFPAPCRVGEPIYPPVACAGGNNTRVGKFTHPSAAPDNNLLIVYTRGAANHNGIYVGAGLAAPYYDGGIYLMRGDAILNRPDDLVLIKNDPRWNEQWPRAVVPYQRLQGVEAPIGITDLENDGSHDSRLAEGTPLALIGSSSLISRDTRPFRGDRFYPHENNGDRNFTFQGADAGRYSDDDIYAIRILALQPVTDRTYPNNGPGFASNFSERVRILGEIPVRKSGVTDAQGNTDTSFLATIPADVPFTFQTLDRNGMALNMAQTWHQVRPGEKRYDCGGCHAHSKPALNFESTAAARGDYVVRNLALASQLLSVDGSSTPGTTSAAPAATIEYLRDIRPILQSKCASCHSAKAGRVEAGLDLDADDRLVDGLYPATYAFLARPRSESNQTRRAITPDGNWWWPQVTRYIRAGQSRQSLLVWKVFGSRLDGRTNQERPTESVAGDPNTIPAGVDFVDCDLDYTGQAMPPPGSPPLTWDERMKIARWVDVGAPIDLKDIVRQRGGDIVAGFLEDDLRPTLALLPSVSQAAAAGRIGRFVIGAYDLESGLDASSLSLTADRPVGGVQAGQNLAGGIAATNGGTVEVRLVSDIDLSGGPLVVTAAIRDRAGHVTRIVRTYRTSQTGGGVATYSVGGRVRASGAGLPGVTLGFTLVSGSGSTPQNVTTDANGNWTQSGFQSGSTYRVGASQIGFKFKPASQEFSTARSDLNFKRKGG